MNGINLSSLENLIKESKKDLSNAVYYENKIINLLNDSSNYYSGTYMKYLFSLVSDQKTNLENVKKIMSNYVEILEMARKKYLDQDSKLSRIIKF